MASGISGKLCFPRDCPTSVGSEEWGVGTEEWEQWEAGVGPVGRATRIRSEWDQEWGEGLVGRGISGERD